MRAQSPGQEEVSGNPLQYSCLVNSMDRRGRWAIVATVLEVMKSQTRLKRLSMHAHWKRFDVYQP